MAGIGFELRKLLRTESYLGLLRAYTYASIISSGPWVFSIIGLIAVGVLSLGVVTPDTLITQFQVTVTYLIMSSLILTGGLQLGFTRWVADRLFERRRDDIAPAYFGVVLVTTAVSGALGWLVALLGFNGVGNLYRVLIVVGLTLLSNLWITTVFLSGLKQYRAIVGLYALGYGISVLPAYFARPWGLDGLLLGFIGGQFVMWVLMLWLVLVGRALWPALTRSDESKPVLLVMFLSTIAIGLFYAAGFMWGKHTHISMVEYWRWWVVHLWVEGFFEVFATAVISLLFVRLGLVRAMTANVAVLASTVVFLFGGVLGTAHHWYFAGTPVSVIAIGAVFSALEVVPLALVGGEAFETYRHTKAAPWVSAYKWPILFFVAVSFWNLLGAGVFGFLINPPLSLYYVQGLNLTANHGHTALFGVYGMLGIGLMLFCLRGLVPAALWNDGLLKKTFWLLNGGLAMMSFLSLFPAGVYQAWASVSEGLWYARSPEIVHSPVMETLVWLRVPGDIVFSVGAVTLALFAWRLVRGVRRTVGTTGADPLPTPAVPAE